MFSIYRHSPKQKHHEQCRLLTECSWPTRPMCRQGWSHHPPRHSVCLAVRHRQTRGATLNAPWHQHPYGKPLSFERWFDLPRHQKPSRKPRQRLEGWRYHHRPHAQTVQQKCNSDQTCLDVRECPQAQHRTPKTVHFANHPPSPLHTPDATSRLGLYQIAKQPEPWVELANAVHPMPPCLVTKR